MEFPPGRLPTDREWPYDVPADPRDVPARQLRGSVTPYSGVLCHFKGVSLFPGPEVDAGDLVVQRGDTLEFYGPVHREHGTRRRFATYERRGGVWCAVRRPAQAMTLDEETP
jgi:hypothetical protein